MATCKDCLYYDACKSYGVIMHNSLKLKMTEGVESKCPYKLFKSRTIKTNADRIRAMSDEELAERLDEWQDWGGGLGKEWWLEWLKQPAEKDGI